MDKRKDAIQAASELLEGSDNNRSRIFLKVFSILDEEENFLKRQLKDCQN